MNAPMPLASLIWPSAGSSSPGPLTNRRQFGSKSVGFWRPRRPREPSRSGCWRGFTAALTSYLTGLDQDAKILEAEHRRLAAASRRARAEASRQTRRIDVSIRAYNEQLDQTMQFIKKLRSPHD